jgi:peptide/nickel transport system ATP-binding protein/oligopeptide transport system ATP-binding protein
LCDQVIVLHLGRIVERGDAASLFELPRHPYTQALLAATLPTKPGAPRDHPDLYGDVTSPVDPPSGCTFRLRCPFVREHCSVEEPELRVLRGGQSAACHFAEEIASMVGSRGVS